MRRHAAARPFTLIELIAVMGVMILLAAVAIPAYSSLFSGRKTTLAANQLNGAVMEARAHAVSVKNYTALVFVKDGNEGYKSFRMAEVYHNPDTDNTEFIWCRWVPGSSFVLLPENTMIPDSENDIGTTSPSSAGNMGHNPLPEVTDLPTSKNEPEAMPNSKSSAPAILFKPNGQLATKEKNVVVRFVETNRYKANSSEAPKLPLNINWLTCKTKFMDPV